MTIPKTTLEEGAPLLRKLGNMQSLTADDVAGFVANIRVGKFAEFVPDALARAQWARQNADVVKEIPAMARTTTQ